MQFLPYAPLALSALTSIPSLISGIMGITEQAKGRGGRLRRRRVHHRAGRKGRGGGRVHHVQYRKKRGHNGGRVRHRAGRKHHVKRRVGRGPISDFLAKIPLIGGPLAGIVRAFGGKVRRGRGLAPMYCRRPYVGAGLAPMYCRRPYVGAGLSPMYCRRPYVGSGMLFPGNAPMRILPYPDTALLARTRVFPAPMQPTPLTPIQGSPFRAYPPIVPVMERVKPAFVTGAYPQSNNPYTPRTGGLLYPPGGRGGRMNHFFSIRNYIPGSKRGGLLAPAGGSTYRRGHMRKVPGKAKKVRVAATTVRTGGYIPYTGYSRSICY